VHIVQLIVQWRKAIVIADADDLRRACAPKGDDAFGGKLRDANGFRFHLAGFEKRDDQRLAEEQTRLKGRASISGRRTRKSNVNLSAVEYEVLTAWDVFFETRCDPWMPGVVFT